MSHIADGKVFDNLQAEARTEALDQDYEESLTEYYYDYDDTQEELEELWSSNKKLKKKLKKRQMLLGEGQQRILSRLNHLEQSNSNIVTLLEQVPQTDSITFDDNHYVKVTAPQLFRMLLICADRQQIDIGRLPLPFFQQSLPTDESPRLEAEYHD